MIRLCCQPLPLQRGDGTKIGPSAGRLDPLRWHAAALGPVVGTRTVRLSLRTVSASTDGTDSPDSCGNLRSEAHIDRQLLDPGSSGAIVGCPFTLKRSLWSKRRPPGAVFCCLGPITLRRTVPCTWFMH